MHQPNEKLLDKEWLRDQYEVQQKSMRTIALELNVTVAVVSKYVKRYGFVVRSAGESKSLTSYKNGPISYNKDASLITKESLIDLYHNKGLSTRLLAAELKVNRRTVMKALKFYNIPIRNLKDARQNRTKQGRTKKALNPILIQNKEEILDSYQRGESIRSIRHRLGLSRDTVYKLLTQEGFQLRTSSEARIGYKHSTETLAKMSKTASDQIMNGTRLSHSNGRKVNCLTPNNGFVTMRSTWEKKYAEYLKSNNIDFYYEPKCFPLSNGKSYIADFYLPATDEYVEIKGYLSEFQKDKYELLKQEYPNLKWNIFYKENLIDLGIDLKKELPTVYLLIGAPGAGKSWIANQLTDKFTYISYDGNPKKEHLTLLCKPTDKPILYDPTFKISTFIRRHSDKFDIKLIVIKEEESVLKDRISQRGGKWTDTIMKRNLQVEKYYYKYGTSGFLGSSNECLEYLKYMIK